MPFIKKRKSTECFSKLNQPQDEHSQEAIDHLMEFFGDSKSKTLCSCELRENLIRDLEEQKHIIEEYDE